MADARFFTRAGPFSLADLADASGAELHPGSDDSRLLHDVAPLEVAGPEDLSFFDNPRYVEAFRQSRAGACLIAGSQVEKAPEGMALLVTPKPYRAYAMVARRFYPELPTTEGIHPRAVVDETAEIGEGSTIGPGAVIGPRVEIGRNCRIGANAVLDAGVVVGEACEIGANAYLGYCLVGARCNLHSGVRIGNRGFGFAMDAEGHLDVPQLGRVIIEDDVEIGANSTVDRGSGHDTVIGAGAKIDNLVQLGHNVRLGKGCVLVAQAGIAGSTKLDDFAVVAAQGGVAGHLHIGKGAQVAAKTGVMRDVPAGQSVMGIPAMPIREFFRLHALLRRQIAGREKGEE